MDEVRNFQHVKWDGKIGIDWDEALKTVILVIYYKSNQGYDISFGWFLDSNGKHKRTYHIDVDKFMNTERLGDRWSSTLRLRNRHKRIFGVDIFIHFCLLLFSYNKHQNRKTNWDNFVHFWLEGSSKRVGRGQII